MGFKEGLIKDLDVFFNAKEFAEPHTIDGRQLSVVVDNDRLKERSGEFNGISAGETLFFVTKEDFGERPDQGAPLIFDSRLFYVLDCREDMGMYEIILTQNRGG